MKNFLITFLFFIFATNNILFAEENTVYNKANAEKCAQGNCVNGQGTLTWTDGTKYEGEFKDDLANGQGTITWTNGATYVGEFKDNKRNGQGTMTYVNGNKYVGEFKDDLFNGQGTFTFKDGDKKVGEWKDGKSVDGKTKLIETAANKRKRIEDEKRQRAKENNDQQRVTNQFTKIKTEAINAINKAQSCYNSLDALGQSQMSGGLLDVKKTHLHAKTTEKNMKISNIDVTRATELHNWYGLTTREANRIVSAYCN